MKRVILMLLFAAVAATGCKKRASDAGKSEPATQPSKTTAATVEEEPVKPLPESVEVNMDKVLLGRALFHDTALSGDGTVACATCHTLDHGGAEPRKTSTGISGQIGPINSPTVLNAAYNIAQFWDGRAKDLQAQAEGPVANPIEMGATWDKVVKRLAANKEYAATFGKLYKDGVTKNNATDAIAEYEKSLITPSRFDKYLRGDKSAITAAEQKGYATFKEVGCTSCHTGVLIGGGMFQKMGLVKDYFSARGGQITEADLGRYNHTKNEDDKHHFKVPTLRNVELTSPYLHDGSRETLEETVQIMGRHQLGRELSESQVSDIVAFLKSLTGELPAHARMPKKG